MSVLRMLFLSAVVMSLTPAALAQHGVATQVDVQAIETAHDKFVQSWNKNEPGAIAALFTKDSLLVTPNGIFTGRKEIESTIKSLLDGLPSPATDFAEPVDYIQMAGPDGAIVAGSWAINSLKLKGFWMDVFEREDSGWKIRARTYNFTPAPQ